MARAVYEENVHVYFATAVTSIAAPTVAEITAATNITSFMTKDGLALNMSENMVNTAGLDSAFDSQIIGSNAASPSLTMFRDDDDEADGFDLMVRGTQGFLIVSWFGPAIATAKASVFPVEIGITQIANSAANEPQKFTVNFAVATEPQLRAVVAA